MSSEFKSGFVAIVGKPNVGKSSLLNSLVGEKISITSSKPQTTRHRILGIRNDSAAQIVFVDTPGLHFNSKRTLNKVINKTAKDSIQGVDVVLMMITAQGWDETDKRILELLKDLPMPVVLVINKVDSLKDKNRLLPLIHESSHLADFREIVPVSAKQGDNLEALHEVVISLLPESPATFPPDQVSDKSERFQAGEMIREQLLNLTNKEVPYSTAVQVEEFETRVDKLFVSATIWVETRGQKKIVVGRGGQMIKTIGERARKQMQYRFGNQTVLNLWVKIREGWADEQTAMSALGYLES